MTKLSNKMACANCVHATIRLCRGLDLSKIKNARSLEDVEGYSYVAFCKLKGQFVVNNAACSRFTPMFVVEPRLEPEVLDFMGK